MVGQERSLIYLRMKIRHIYHPQNIDNPDQWFLCNCLIGAQPYRDIGEPIELHDELVPDWSKNLTNEELVSLDLIQEKYIRIILEWIDGQNIIQAYIDGGYEDSERSILNKISIYPPQNIVWNSSYIDPLISVNVRNMYLVAETGSKVVIYGSWESIFINPSQPLPKAILKPISLETLE